MRSIKISRAGSIDPTVLRQVKTDVSISPKEPAESPQVIHNSYYEMYNGMSDVSDVKDANFSGI